MIRLRGRVGYALAAHNADPQAKVDVVISYRFVEDGGNGEEGELTVTPPPEFESIGEQPYLFRGTVTHERLNFEFESAPYPADWTGRLKGDVLVASDEGSKV